MNIIKRNRSNNRNKEMPEFEITIQEDGSLMLSRGDRGHNDVMLGIVDAVCPEKDKAGLEEFFAFADQSETLFGPGQLCG